MPIGVDVPDISKYLKNIFESGELEEKLVVSILETTTQRKGRQTKFQENGELKWNLIPLFLMPSK